MPKLQATPDFTKEWLSDATLVGMVLLKRPWYTPAIC